MNILIKGIEMPKTGVYVLSVDNTGKDKTIFTIAEHTHSGKIIPRYVGEAVLVPSYGRLIDADTPITVREECEWGFPVSVKTTVSKFLLGHIIGEIPPTIIEAEVDDG